MRSIKQDRGLFLAVGRRSGEEGFALIAALLVFWVLTALGMLVFSVTTQDVRVSSRTVGERKALTAAESGIHVLTQNFNPGTPGNSAVSGVVVDSSGDPNTKYTIGPSVDPNGNPTWNPTSGPDGVPIPGYAMGGGETWGRQWFVAQVTGTNTAYNSSAQINVGVGYGPVDISTIYR